MRVYALTPRSLLTYTSWCFEPTFQQMFYISFTVQDGDDLHDCGPPIHDHVLIQAEEEHVAVGEIAAFMAFARNTGQTLERVHQLSLNAVGYG